MFDKIGKLSKIMFDNIGSKIKKLAIIIAICGFVISILYGIITIILAPPAFLSGLFIIAIGCVSSWLGSFFTYGFGELVENSAIMAGKTTEEKNKKVEIKKYKPLSKRDTEEKNKKVKIKKYKPLSKRDSVF